MTDVAQWVQDLTAKAIETDDSRVYKPDIGSRVMYEPQKGTRYEVEIESGQYWGLHGLSNFWRWRRVNSDGSLATEIEPGYGFFYKKSKI